MQSTFFELAPWREQMLADGRVVAWFSRGATSAVASKMAVDKYLGKRELHLVFTDPRSEDEDNDRFMRDFEQWVQYPVTVLASDRYYDVDDVISKERYLRGPEGAKCTGVLKKAMRHRFQQAERDIQIFGFDARPKEIIRAALFRQNNPEVVLECPLQEAGLTHADCIAIIRAAGLLEPLMYRQGFPNANCPGCVKAEGAGYWNLVRKYYPRVFAKRAWQERSLGYALVRVKGKPIYLDELPADAQDEPGQAPPSCDLLCGTPDDALPTDLLTL
jgi:hypothetical protein